jgi:hypothetical protein
MPKKEKAKRTTMKFLKNWQFLRKIRIIATKYIFPFFVHFGEISH